MTSSTVTGVEYLSLWICARPARYEAPGRVSSAPTTNVVRGDPLLSSRFHLGGPLSGLAALRARRRSLRRSWRPVYSTNAATSASPPRAMSTAGLRVFLVVLVVLEF